MASEPVSGHLFTRQGMPLWHTLAGPADAFDGTVGRKTSFITVLAVFVALLNLVSSAFGQESGTARKSISSAPVQAHSLWEQIARPRFADGSLPNGWRITPAGKTIAAMGDLITNIVASPDGRVLAAINSGFVPHGIDVFDAKTSKRVQHIGLDATFLGMSWSPDGRALFVSGGNAAGPANQNGPSALIYEFTYANGRLGAAPVTTFSETVDPSLVQWSGLAYVPAKARLYAANLGTDGRPSNIVVFDTNTRRIVTRIPVELNPYQVVLTPDGSHLFVSNWSSESVSVIDTGTNTVIRTLHVGSNPNDMRLSADGRLFIACSNDNMVYVIDAHDMRLVERLSTTFTPLAPEGSTPNALVIDNARKLLYIANADNNSIAVAHIGNRNHSKVIGFIPTAWYPSALALVDRGNALYIGNSKGQGGHPDVTGPESPLAVNKASYPWGTAFPLGDGSVHTLQTSSIQTVPLSNLKRNLPIWTKQVMENTPYNDSLLAEARPSIEPSIIPRRVGASSPIKHVIYVIKENRTYDQVFGDLHNANGDPRLTIFGEKVTPNQHALAKTYVTLDNLYCDGEVSADGHYWTTAAYATDFNEKQWPSGYARRNVTAEYWGTARAAHPSSGFLWDLAARKGLTYRNYEEGTSTVITGGATATDDGRKEAVGLGVLAGHVAKDYYGDIWVRDSVRWEIFQREFRAYEANYDSLDPNKRLPNLIVMRLPEDHTLGSIPGKPTPTAMVANNDFVIGQLVDAVSHSRYWPNTAIFIIEDDGQDGPDHVDARRTVGLVISPYVKRGIVDSTLYSTSSMVRSIELLLGLPPMSQYDAAAMPMYASFGTDAILAPFEAIKPLVDVNEVSTELSYGADASTKMDLSELDRAPMHALNEIIWKSVKGAESEMPAPVHRFRPLVDIGGSSDDDDN